MRSMAVSGDLDAARGSSERVRLVCVVWKGAVQALVQARLLPRDNHLQHCLADHEEHELGVTKARTGHSSHTLLAGREGGAALRAARCRSAR